MASPPLPASATPTARLLGTTPTMAALRAQIHHLATFDTIGSALVPTLLIQGETGTGKGLVARVVHESGPRANGSFVDVNCAAIPETMLEAELFGFEPGAFTDAKRAKPGLFEAASGGTLFLDEIDALPLALQGKLLTAIEAKQVRRLGAVAAHAVDVKLIAATNAVLSEAIAAGRFRADLYHRLAVVVVALSPLRERQEDILVLARTFLQQYTEAHGVPSKRLNTAAEAWLQNYAWPGNVRELSHVMERVTLLHVGAEVDVATLAQLCLPLTAPTPGAATAPQEVATADALPATVAQIRQALIQTGGNVARAARLLGVSRDTVRYRMQRYGLARTPLEVLSPSVLAPPPRARPEILSPTLGTPRRHSRHDTTAASDVSGAVSAWEQKPVVILAVEITWPEMAGHEPIDFDPWTARVRWEQAIVEKVQGFGGVLLHRTTALLSWAFGLPQALEQLPQRAVHSAMAIRQMVTAAPVPELGPGPVVRLAVHLGALQVEHPAQIPPARVLAVGNVLALPVRLLGQAGPGEVVISPEVGRLVDGWVALEARALQLHHDDPGRVGGYAVVGARPGRARRPPGGNQTRSSFVGRAREITLLETLLEQVQAGQGQVVGLVGTPGMGKSRLLAEMQHRCSTQGIAYYEGHCLAYGSTTPYLPVLGLLRDHCGIADGDRPAELSVKVRRALEACGESADVALALLLDLLGSPIMADQIAGFSAEARRVQTFTTLWQLFLASSRRQPLVLAVENLHWIDPTSEAWLAALVERLSGVPLLLLTTARPGYRPPWGDRSYVTQLALPPLDPDASREVVCSVLTQHALAPAMEQQLLAKAEGNPFFLEELAHAVREQEGPQPILAVPDTIQAVLAVRLDRLPAPEKRLIQAAAVIGKDVPVSLLQAILALPEATLQGSLAYLQEAELLFPKSFVPTLTYTFKHVLIQEAAYHSLPASRRQHDHRQVAQVLIEQFPEIASAQPEVLAQHYTEAGATTQALPVWQRAGQRAAERSAHLEAIAHFTRGLASLQALPDTPERDQHELTLQLSLGVSVISTQGYAAPDVKRIYIRARTLCQRLGEHAQLADVLRGLWYYHTAQGQPHTARELGEQLLMLGQRLQDQALRLEAHRLLGTTLARMGELLAARAHLAQALSLYDPHQHGMLAFRFVIDPGAISQAYVAWLLWMLGYPDQARQQLQAGLTMAAALPHPFTKGLVCVWASVLHQWFREAQVARELAETAITLSTERGFPFWRALGTILRGWALTVQAQHAEGMAQVSQGLAAWRTLGEGLLPLGLALAAETSATLGQTTDSLMALDEALALVEKIEERFCEAELYRLKGEMLRHLETPRACLEAEACFQQALAIARRQSAKSWELRAATSLARLWQQQGKRSAAGLLLTEIYGWFTEGFETPDLQDARALLDDLR